MYSALCGGVLGSLNLALVRFWVHRSLRGSVPARGGALVVGTLPRLRRENPRPLHSLLIGLGVIILMNSRPFEGGLLAALVVALSLPALRRRWRVEGVDLLRRLALPAAVVVLIGTV